jgi:hypothetical protein
VVKHDLEARVPLRYPGDFRDVVRRVDHHRQPDFRHGLPEPLELLLDEERAHVLKEESGADRDHARRRPPGSQLLGRLENPGKIRQGKQCHRRESIGPGSRKHRYRSLGVRRNERHDYRAVDFSSSHHAFQVIGCHAADGRHRPDCRVRPVYHRVADKKVFCLHGY